MRRARRDRTEARTTAAIALVFGGTLCALAILFRLELDHGSTLIAWSVGQVLIGALGQAMRRRRPWSGLPGRIELVPCALALGTGLGTFAFSLAFVAGITALGGGTMDAPPSDIVYLLGAVVAAPLLEEWVCRGVLWDALRPYSEPRGRILACAVLFGLLHCLEGLLGFVHRFVSGIAFGWLRERTHSLVPPVLAHATHNAACCAWNAWYA